MTSTRTSDAYYDPYDVAVERGSVPDVPSAARRGAALLQRQVRLLRGEPVRRRRARTKDRETYISGRGAILELIRANLEMPPGVIIFEDPPIHTVHRQLLSRVFTPKKMNALEPTDPRLLRREPRPADRRGRVRLRDRPRRADADARDRHASRDPGTGPRGDPRPRRPRRCAPKRASPCTRARPTTC